MSYCAQINRLGLSALFDLKGQQSAIGEWLGSKAPAFPNAPNTASSANGIELYWIGNSHWLFRAPPDRETEFLSRTVPGDISIVLISDAMAFFQISGPDAAQLLSIACPLDIRPNAFPQNGVTYTEAFGLKALLLRRPDGFEMAVESSFADMLDDYLTRARGA